MPPEIVKQGETFLTRFTENYKEWLRNPNIKHEEDVPKKNYLSKGALNKREGETDENDRVETNSELPGHTIHGFKNEIKSLKNFLLDQKVYNEFKSLVVVGEYGVGKTALCKTIFNDEDVKSVYAPRIWVSMHSTEGLGGKISVLKKILTVLGVGDDLFKSIHDKAKDEAGNNLEDADNREAGEIDRETAEEKEVSALLYALHLNLRWKKYLIVFDDVREEDNWNEMLQDDEEKLKKDKRWGKYLSDGFPKGSGGRVIYTTRDESKNLAKKLVAEEHEIHRLWPLTDSLSVWRIYDEARIENGEDDPPRNDKKCIEELMNKSRGLPLAVRLLATLLPVFLDDENTEQNGSTNGTTGSDNTTTEQNGSTQPPTA
ncbi:unnamed protein product [Brassica rapa]|uniref:NB-ARC domain-containing protein n=1 Tax=Brassica campestris TaxID=3711 RepID=A0A3P6B2K5_BRACM|nr:unnamed protein product [Brassica rapa]VDC90701.1 unnamed protein product [Brassica rapa]